MELAWFISYVTCARGRSRNLETVSLGGGGGIHTKCNTKVARMGYFPLSMQIGGPPKEGVGGGEDLICVSCLIMNSFVLCYACRSHK